eukprot:scaffold195707_cov30-Tisochrysis_lutea.AAC.1
MEGGSRYPAAKGSDALELDDQKCQISACLEDTLETTTNIKHVRSPNMADEVDCGIWLHATIRRRYRACRTHTKRCL